MRIQATIQAVLIGVAVSAAQPSITTIPYLYDWTNPAPFVVQSDGKIYLGGGDGFWGSYDADGVPGFVVDAAGYARTNKVGAYDLLFAYVNATGKQFTGGEFFGFQASRVGTAGVIGTLQVYANYTLLRTYNVATQLSTSMQSFVVPLPGSLGNTVFGVGILVYSNTEIRVDNTRFGGGALPITLSSFHLSMQGTSVRLQWSTVSEVENYGFYVQKSDDMTNWSEVPNSFQSGFGTTSEPHAYTFTDNAQPLGKLYRLRQVDLDGASNYSEAVSVAVTAVETETGVKEFSLGQNFPNPFNPTTLVSSQYPVVSDVKLVVYNLLGQEVATLVNERRAAGRYQDAFNGAGLPSGVYFYRLTASDPSAAAGKPFVQTHTMVLAK